MPEKEKQSQGFSLIEILITIFILGAILISLLPVFIYGFNLVSRTKQTTLATQFAQEEVEKFRNLDFATIAAITTVTTDLTDTSLLSEYPSLFSPEGNPLLSNGTQTVTIEQVPDDVVDEIRKLTVRITWNYRGEIQEKTVVTYLYNDGINKKI